MKKISMIALTLILTAGLLTACRMPSTEDTTNPSTTATTPSTAATTPTTTPATVPTVPATLPDPTDGTDATDGTGNTDTTDPTDSMPGKNRRMAPRR